MIPDYKIKINESEISHFKAFLFINKKNALPIKFLKFKAFK